MSTVSRCSATNPAAVSRWGRSPGRSWGTGLPFDGFAPSGEEVLLLCDQHVQCLAVEAEIAWATDKATAVLPDDTHDRPVTLGVCARRQVRRLSRAQLVIVNSQE
jgi:hypothetical protein